MFAKLESKILEENLISKFPKGHVEANEEDKFNQFPLNKNDLSALQKKTPFQQMCSKWK